jgi:hypothetical protein
MTNKNEPAFPVSALVYNEDGKDPTTIIHDGMTLRDYFAAKAMQSILSSDRYLGLIGINRFEQRNAEDAYKMADAMMKARTE